MNDEQRNSFILHRSSFIVPLPSPLKPDAHVRLIADIRDRVGIAQVPADGEILAPGVAAGEVEAGVLPRLPDHAELDAALLEEQAVVTFGILDVEGLVSGLQ